MLRSPLILTENYMLEMKRDWLNRFKAFKNVKTRRVIALNDNKLHKKQYPNFQIQ